MRRWDKFLLSEGDMPWLIHLTGRKIQRSATKSERYKRGGDVQSRQNRQENSEESMEEDDYKADIWYILPTPYSTPTNTRSQSLFVLTCHFLI